MKTFYILFGLQFFVAPLAILAQKIEPIQTDRPDQTETPSTVPAKHFQMETGFSFERSNLSDQVLTIPSILYKFGLNDHFEVGLITEYSSSIINLKKIFGLSPITVRFKEKIVEENGLLPLTSFIGYLSIPMLASTNLKENFYTPSFRFTMQHTLTDKFSLGYNLGAEWDGETAVPSFIYTLTSGFSITEKIGSYVEFYGFAPQTSMADHRFDGGLNYLLKPNILFDISGGFGISTKAPDYYVALGFSFRVRD